NFNELTSSYRHRFNPSPILCCCDEDKQAIKILFKRLVLMINNLSLPQLTTLAIKITPSVLSNDYISEKAIPYYYRVNEATDPLYFSWNDKRKIDGTAKQILSYNSNQYNTADDFVQYPLKFDLEAYNFFRIEGAIGKKYTDAMTELKTIIDSNRLPINIISLAVGDDVSGVDMVEGCNLNDIQMQYDLLKNQMLCCLNKSISYWGQLQIS